MKSKGDPHLYDVIIIGGGPAGLSAALILARCLRNVLVYDDGKPRNAASRSLHGYLTRDGIPPSEFIRICREEVSKYQNVTFIDEEVVEAKAIEGGFQVANRSGESHRSRKLLIATGIVDRVPKVEGIMNFYGKSVFHCPYCDGWENRGRKIAVYGKGERGRRLALSMKTWSKDIILCTDGPHKLNGMAYEQLQKNEIIVREEKIKCLEGEDECLSSILFENGERIYREVMFFSTESFLRSRLLEQLRCPFTEENGVPTEKYEKTKVPGLYVAGNILREVQLVIVAAAEGAEAAFGINSALTKESLQRPYTSPTALCS